MAGFSDYVERATLRGWMRGTAITLPTGWWIGLYNGDPTDSGAAVSEISGNAYARTAVTFQDVAGSGDPGPCKNNSVTFPTATPGSWGLITHFAIWDAVTAGNMICSGALTASKTVGAGDTLRFPADNLTVTLD